MNLKTTNTRKPPQLRTVPIVLYTRSRKATSSYLELSIRLTLSHAHTLTTTAPLVRLSPVNMNRHLFPMYSVPTVQWPHCKFIGFSCVITSQVSSLYLYINTRRTIQDPAVVSRLVGAEKWVSALGAVYIPKSSWTPMVGSAVTSAPIPII